jgi:hypothetical protein
MQFVSRLPLDCRSYFCEGNFGCRSIFSEDKPLVVEAFSAKTTDERMDSYACPRPISCGMNSTQLPAYLTLD